MPPEGFLGAQHLVLTFLIDKNFIHEEQNANSATANRRDPFSFDTPGSISLIQCNSCHANQMTQGKQNVFPDL